MSRPINEPVLNDTFQQLELAPINLMKEMSFASRYFLKNSASFNKYF